MKQYSSSYDNGINVGGTKLETNILLESGTNELEVLEFCVGNQHYGINVAKIKEILPYKEPTLVPNSHKSIEGIYMPRNEIITVISLYESLNIAKIENKKEMLIVTNFNKLCVGFHVTKVLGIHRVSWADILKPDQTISSVGEGLATGIIKLNDRLIIILDFEKIVADVSPATTLKMDDVINLGPRERNEKPVLIAEDSPMLFQLIKDCLNRAGYNNLILTTNGQEAWDKISDIVENGNISRDIACVITDLEMPKMDGHHLTKLIKSSERLKHIPVIIFSSLVNEEMKKKGEKLGANAQISKPEIGTLVETMDKFIFQKQK